VVAPLDEITLRAGGRDEAAALATLIRVAFAAQPIATDPPSSALRETPATIAAHFDGGGGAIVVEDLRVSMLVAALLWSEKADGLYLGRLAVHPAWRGRGLGRRLIDAAELTAHLGGHARLFLSTRLALVDNRRLFLSCGFVETRQTAHPGYCEPTSVEMERRLTATANRANSRR
jgi:GNAT superfamily N-acetyltransferase